jgi:hypothetical protein
MLILLASSINKQVYLDLCFHLRYYEYSKFPFPCQQETDIIFRAVHIVDKNEVLEARREYYRNWKAKNRDKVREANKRYWAKYAERRAAEKAKAAQEGRP